MGEKIVNVKVRKLVGWGKNSLLCKEKSAHTSKSKHGIHSLLSQAGKYSTISRKARLIKPSGFSGRQKSSLKTFSVLLYPSFIAEHDAIWYGMSLWPVWVSCPFLCLLPATCAPPASSLVVQHETKKYLMLCEHCCATTENLMCYHHYFHQKFKTQHHTSLYKEK